jgi:hypothetical protein
MQRKIVRSEHGVQIDKSVRLGEEDANKEHCDEGELEDVVDYSLHSQYLYGNHDVYCCVQRVQDPILRWQLGQDVCDHAYRSQHV